MAGARKDIASGAPGLASADVSWVKTSEGSSIDWANWNAWGNSMWPSVYLIDRNGRIRYWWYGELNWQNQTGEQQLRRRIEELLSER